jgi:NADH-quinone oxidoreductase subunit L
MPWTFAMMALATLAIAGVPPLAGFFSKDEILAAAFARGGLTPVYLVAWVLGLLAALCTAFYMARLMTLTFLGSFRGQPATAAHLHEAPPVMTAPVVVLGGLTVVGGLLNLPAILGGHQRLEQWLAPVIEHADTLLVAAPHLSHGTELGLIAGAVLIAVIGLGLGYRATSVAPVPLPAAAPPERGLGRLLAGKYFVDEIYHALIVAPLMWISRTVLWRTIDMLLIDRLTVGGTVRVAQGLGWLGSRLQNGQVALYVSLFAVGAILVIRALVGG